MSKDELSNQVIEHMNRSLIKSWLEGIEDMDPIEAFQIIHEIVDVYGDKLSIIDIGKLVMVAEWLKGMIETKEETPRFAHHCSTCLYLGGYRSPVDLSIHHDLWWCPQNGVPTIIARYGEEDSAYTSGSPLDQISYEKHYYRPTNEGYRRAVAKGLSIVKPR